MERAHDPRRARVRRRRRVALLTIVAAVVLLAGFLFVNSRGGVTHPTEWVKNPHGTRHETVKFESRAVGKQLAYDVILPRDYEKSQHRPMLVLLHGRGAKANH